MGEKTENTIREAIHKAQANGIKIVRGPWAIWGPDNKLEACCATGAVLWAHGKMTEPCQSGMVQAACDLLQEDARWLVRFWQGFDRGFAGFTLDKNDKIVGEDSVGAFGVSLWNELGDK